MCTVIHWHKCLQRYKLTATGLCCLDGSTRRLFPILVFLTLLLTNYRDRVSTVAWYLCSKWLQFGIYVLYQLENFSCIFFFTQNLALGTNMTFNFTTVEFTRIRPISVNNPFQNVQCGLLQSPSFIPLVCYKKFFCCCYVAKIIQLFLIYDPHNSGGGGRWGGKKYQCNKRVELV